MVNDHVNDLPPQESPVEKGWIRLDDDPNPRKEFRGEFIARSSGKRHNRTNWTELTLYRTTDGSGRYMLHVVAKSTVYHKIDGCDQGVATPLTELADRYLDLNCTEPIPTPCKWCQPIDIEDDNIKGITVMMEVDWPRVRECHNVVELFNSLQNTKGPAVGEFGRPAIELLRRARQVDEDIAAMFKQVERI